MFDLSTSVSDLSADDECIKVPQRQRHIRERVHPMLFYTEFEARFRVSKETVTFLEERIGAVLQPSMGRNKSLSDTLQILIALRF